MNTTANNPSYFHLKTTLKTLIFVFLCSFLSCSPSQKGLVPRPPKLVSECPKEGVCEVSVFKNKQLLVRQDDFGGLYYDLEDHDGTTVIHFQYHKTTDAGLQDGHYREDLLMEIKNSDSELHLKDSELQQAKLLFGRHCFCKGQTGYFLVTQGRLQVRQAPSFALSLSFEMTKVPHLIGSLQLE